MIQPEHFLHAAVDEHAQERAKQQQHGESCTDENAQKTRRAYEKELRKEGLGAEDLGFGAVVSRTYAVLIGFFTSFVFSQLVKIVEGPRTWQLATISLSVTLIVLAAERFYLETVGKTSFATSRSWAAIWMQFMRFFTIIIVFLTTNFGLAVFTDMTKTAQMTWFESIALVYIVTLAFIYLMHAYKHQTI